jgi:hypothetical protein
MVGFILLRLVDCSVLMVKIAVDFHERLRFPLKNYEIIEIKTEGTQMQNCMSEKTYWQ